MKVKIWGCRGSVPAPLTPQQIEEKIVQAIYQLPDAVDTGDLDAVQAYALSLGALQRGTAGGNTTCVEIETDGKTFVIDAGTGIRELGLELMQGAFGRGEGELHLFFSHAHWDHIQGFPFFNPAYVAGNRIFIYSVHDVQKALVEQQHFLTFPVPMSIMTASIEFITLNTGEPLNIGDVTISCALNAHPGDSYGFRFEDDQSCFVFASDAEYKELVNGSVQPHLAFFKDADALIFDAQYSLNEGWIKEDWGHSSAMIGVDMALSAGVKRLILFHHDPEYDDAMLQGVSSVAEAYRDEIAHPGALEIMVAFEGLTLDLAPHHAQDARTEQGRHTPILVSARVFDERSAQRVADSLVVVGDETASKSRIIDLSRVETLTTASLKQLVQLQHADDRLPLILAAPSPSAMRVIELGGFSDFFAIYSTVEAAQAAVAARERAQLPGQMLGSRYLIERVLAERRIGVVLGAVDQQTGEEVAVRIIDPAFSDEALDRLFVHREHLLQADHPNLLRIHDLAREEHTTYIVEDYHPGPTLEDFLAAYPNGMPLDKGLIIAQEIVAGLAYAHGLEIVHSNLGAEKIFVDESGVRIGGMALGHLEGRFNLMEVPLLRQDAGYLAPEQVLAQPIDARSDLYALGVILYQLFTGRLPFTGSESEILQAQLLKAPVPPADLNERIFPALNDLILKLLAKSAADRFATAAEVQRKL